MQNSETFATNVHVCSKCVRKLGYDFTSNGQVANRNGTDHFCLSSSLSSIQICLSTGIDPMTLLL